MSRSFIQCCVYDSLRIFNVQCTVCIQHSNSFIHSFSIRSSFFFRLVFRYLIMPLARCVLRIFNLFWMIGSRCISTENGYVPGKYSLNRSILITKEEGKNIFREKNNTTVNGHFKVPSFCEPSSDSEYIFPRIENWHVY